MPSQTDQNKEDSINRTEDVSLSQLLPILPNPLPTFKEERHTESNKIQRIIIEDIENLKREEVKVLNLEKVLRVMKEYWSGVGE